MNEIKSCSDNPRTRREVDPSSWIPISQMSKEDMVKHKLSSFSWTKLKGLGQTQIRRGIKKGNLEKIILKAAKNRDVPEEVCISPAVITACLEPGFIFRKFKIQQPHDPVNWSQVFETVKLEQLLQVRREPVRPASQASFLTNFPMAFLKMALQSNCDKCIEKMMFQP